MLRRAKSVDIPFMVKGYEIGLRDGNFSESKMQINAFFANTTTHKNVHSYVYENNGNVAGYAILRKKDERHHEIMMMFVDPTQQGQGVGRKFLTEILDGPMKDSPIICSTTQPASKRMMQLLKGLGFERKIEAPDGVYWEKGANTSPPSTQPKQAPAPVTTSAPLPRLALPIPLLSQGTEKGPDAEALEAATTVIPLRVSSYASRLPPTPTPLEETTEVLSEAASSSPPEHSPEAEPSNSAELLSPEINTSDASVKPVHHIKPPDSPLDSTVEPPVLPEPSITPAPVPPIAVDNVISELTKLPQPPADFSGRPSELGYASKRAQAQQLARELFASLKGQETPPEVTPPDQHTIVAEEEDIPVLATLNVVREKMGSLPGVSLPPLNRYSLMEFNKKDLENMNVVELAALSAQLIKLAKDQLAEIDKLKSKSKSRF